MLWVFVRVAKGFVTAVYVCVWLVWLVSFVSQVCVLWRFYFFTDQDLSQKFRNRSWILLETRCQTRREGAMYKNDAKRIWFLVRTWSALASDYKSTWVFLPCSYQPWLFLLCFLWCLFSLFSSKKDWGTTPNVDMMCIGSVGIFGESFCLESCFNTRPNPPAHAQTRVTPVHHQMGVSTLRAMQDYECWICRLAD